LDRTSNNNLQGCGKVIAEPTEVISAVKFLPITMHDAQNLCVKNFKMLNERLDPLRAKGWTPFVMVSDILEEAGEVASVVKGLEGFKPPEKTKTKEMLATELSDLLYMIFVLAEYYGIELEQPFVQTINSYLSRSTR
jgi:NTP pyrophosphatase (non-canonical NTP hydrolase)